VTRSRRDIPSLYERVQEFDAVRLCAGESVVVECVEVEDLCLFEGGHAVAVVVLPATPF
jgi:hypothetical protein